MRWLVSAQSVLSANLHSRGKQRIGKKLRKDGGLARGAAPLDGEDSLAADRVAQQVSRMEAIGQLAGGIAHDFNNLLTVILGHSEFLLKRDEPAKSRRVRIDEIRKAAERGAWLTNQLLAYSRNQLLEPTVLKINSVLEDMDDILRRVLGEDIVLELRPDPDLGWVKVDRGQLQQIILNLAGNARDAMPQGGVYALKRGTFPSSMAPRSRRLSLRQVIILRSSCEIRGKAWIRKRVRASSSRFLRPRN
jgi:signal transduction histidine kinase